MMLPRQSTHVPKTSKMRALGLRGGMPTCYSGGDSEVYSVRGVLITFEGVEGSGKSTQIRRLERWLKREGYRPETTSEPDGTALGVAVRRLFEREPRPLAEMFLFMAARHQHVVEKVRPWLRAGRVVLCDRDRKSTRLNSSHDQISYAGFC